MAIDFPIGTDFPGGDIPDGHKHEGFYWDATIGAWKRDCDDAAGGSGTVFYQDDPPESTADNPLETGNLWINSDNLLLHVWTGDEWVEVGSACGIGGGSTGSTGIITTRDVKTIPRDDGNPFEVVQDLSDILASQDPATQDPIDDLLKTQEDVNDFIALVSERTLRGMQRTVDNVDLLQNTVSVGGFVRKPKALSTPTSGTCYMLLDGGAEATDFAGLQNLLIAKDGLGPYANFEDARPGDVLLIQNDNNTSFGEYIITNVTELALGWDFGLRLSKERAQGDTPPVDDSCKIRIARPVPTIASDTAPVFSESGQLWYDTVEDCLKVWDQEDGQFYNVGGECSPDEVDLTPIQDQIDTIDGTVTALGDRVDNVEQLQRELHDIVSESVYSLPSFSLSNPEPQIGQYIVASTTYDASDDNQIIGGVPDLFEQVKMIRIAAAAGPHGHLERAEVGDRMTIQTIGTDAGGQYQIQAIRERGTGPDVYYEMSLTFIAGLADGNIVVPNDAQIQVIKAEAVEEEAPQSQFEIRTYLSRGNNYFDLPDGTAAFNTGTYTVAPIDKEFYYNGRVLYINGYKSTLKDVSHQEDPQNVVGLQTRFKIEEYESQGRDYSRLHPAGHNCTFSAELPFITKEYSDTRHVDIEGDEMTGGLIVPNIVTDQIENNTTALELKYNGQNALTVGPNRVVADLPINAKDGVETLSVDSGQNSNLLLKHDGNTKVYVGSTETTFQETVKLNKEGTADNHAVTKAYVDSSASKSFVNVFGKARRVTSSMGATTGDIMFTGPNGQQPSRWNDVEKVKIWFDDLDDYSPYNSSNLSPDAAIRIMLADTGQTVLLVQISGTSSTGTTSMEWRVLGKNYIEMMTTIAAGVEVAYELVNVFREA